MRKAVQKQILELLETLLEAHREIQEGIENKEYHKVTKILVDCQECAIIVGNTIDQFEENQQTAIQQLEEYCEKLFFINNELEESAEKEAAVIRKGLDKYIKAVRREVKKIRIVLKIVFMPYKASMWTSLESVWKATCADSDCEVKVVVIPYYNLDNQGNKISLEYEASLFPKDVPIVPYSQYQLAAEMPDMIFIHNPYDDMNNVTRVPEMYYSYNLKKYTEQLIYSPYGMMGYYNPSKGAFMCCTNAVMTADKILVQSNRVKRIYMDYGIPEEKLIALGSPKVDAIVDGLKNPVSYPEGWQEKLAGRKVFLLNTHLSYLIRGHIYQLEHPEHKNYAIVCHENILNRFIDNPDISLIWRPHPLLKTTLKSRNLSYLVEKVEEWERRIQESENCLLDTNGDYTISIRISDALITSYSSLISEYMISGKPIYIYQQRLNEENYKNSPVDYTHNYYRARVGESARFPGFVQMVMDGTDYLYEERMRDVNKAFGDLNGTIGAKIFEKLKWEL